MRIALATDHAGYDALKQLKVWLESEGHVCVDFGPANLQPDDDYPDFIFPAAHSVANGDCERGVILGGSGEGEAIAANRVRGVRCSVFYGPSVAKKVIDAEGHTSHDPYAIVKLSREHNDSNVLSLAARFVTLEDMKHVIKLWLETPFGHDERHARRNNKLDGG